MHSSKAPEYAFIAAYLQLQVVQEYLTLWDAVKGPYAAAVQRHLSAALAALYGNVGCCGQAGCMEAIRERCKGHPAFSGGDGLQALAQIVELRHRYASLFLNAPTPTAVSFSAASHFIADTESVLRVIGRHLFATDPAQADGEDFIAQFERLQKSR